MNAVPLNIIAESIAEYFNCSVLDIFIKSRKLELIKPRQWFHYQARDLNSIRNISLGQIGRYYSDKSNWVIHHATVIHSHKAVRDEIHTYNDYKIIDKEIKSIIKDKITEYKSFSRSSGKSNNLFCAQMTFNKLKRVEI